MNRNDYKKLFASIEEYINDNLEGVDRTILNAVKARKNGKSFSFNEHVKGLIFSLLSNQRKWKRINQNRPYIEELFLNFDKNKIKNCDYHYFINNLKKYSLGNRAIKKQMETLNYNISILEKIEKEYGSLDNFITRLNPLEIAVLLACQESQYKLKQIGIPLALEYLRNVGINTVKPDVHIVRLFERLGFLQESKSIEKDVLDIISKLSKESGYPEVHIDFLLWNYCAEGYGDICSENKPRCSPCKFKEFCEYYNT